MLLELQDSLPSIDVVLAIFHRVSKHGDREIFLQERSEQEWEFPGGKVELGEELKGALIREVMEEMGVDITSLNLDFMETFEFSYPTVKVFLHCYLLDGDACLDETLTWFKLQDVLDEKFPIIEGSKKIILSLARKLYA